MKLQKKSWRYRILVSLLRILIAFHEAQSSFGEAVDPSADLISATATFDMRGVRGYVTFSESMTNATEFFAMENVTVSVDYRLESWHWMNATGAPIKDELYITIHEFPVLSNYPGDRCSDQALGKQLHGRDFQIGPLRLNYSLPGHLDNVKIPLRGHQSILGRSLLAITAKGRRVCATIAFPSPFSTRIAIARMRGSIAGDVYFRQLAASSVHTSIYVDLYKLIPDGMPKNATYRWQLMTTGPLDRTRPEDEVSCRTMRVLFDPDFRDEEQCSSNMPHKCKIGNMLQKFGGLPVGSVTSSQRAFFTDTEFSISQWTTGRGIYVALFSPLNPLVSVSCGEIRPLSPKLAQVTFSQDGVKGVIKFRQASHFDSTEVYVNIKGLASEATNVLIHQFPRRQRILAKEDLCTAQLVGNIYNPLETKQSAVNSSTATQDELPIGDLSAKYGNLTGKDMLEEEYFDSNLPLFGPLSVVGRSVMIYKSNGSRWMCSNIWSNGDAIIARVRLYYTVGGTIILRQSAEDWRSETTIFGDLFYTNGVPISSTKNHNWRVHSGIVERDAFSFDARCKNALDVYNPLERDTRKNYSTECQPSKPYRCQLGDLGSKLEPLAVALKSSDGNGRFLFTDSYLPLSGPLSVVGRSIVIYSREMGGDRLACGNIERVYPVNALAKSWIGRSSVHGFFAASQPTPFHNTQINIGLDELNRGATSLSVHQAPVESDLVIPCTAESIGVDFDPFNASIPVENRTASGDNVYAIGDLSSKYGSLAGLTSYARQTFDENLPLTGIYSIVGRSVAVRQSRESRSWACADIVHDFKDQEKVKLIEAVAEFPGPFLWGYMRMFQVLYPDGATSSLTIQVRLAHMVNGSIDYERASSGHRWAIGQLPVATDASIIYEDFRCITAGLTDNYFNTATEGEEYRRECWAGNPTRCSYGDVTPRLGTLKLGIDERQVFTDEMLQLKGNTSLIGRSVVIFDTREGDGKEIRLACANIEKEEQAKTTISLLHTGVFDSVGFQEHVARVANLSQWNVWINYGTIKKMYHDSCVQVEVNFRAPKAHDAMRTFTNFIDFEQFKFLGYESCDKRKISNLAEVPGSVFVKPPRSDDETLSSSESPDHSLALLLSVLILFLLQKQCFLASQI